MPVHRASALSGTLLAEAARTLIGTVLIAAAGLTFGFRFSGGFSAGCLPPGASFRRHHLYDSGDNGRGPFQNRALLTWLGTGSIGLVFGSVVLSTGSRRLCVRSRNPADAPHDRVMRVSPREAMPLNRFCWRWRGLSRWLLYSGH